MDWLPIEDALDWLRVGEESTGIVQGILVGIPAEVELRTGYPAEDTVGEDCEPLVQQLVRFMLLRYYNPDGADATQLTRVVDSLTMAVQALCLSEASNE